LPSASQGKAGREHCTDEVQSKKMVSRKIFVTSVVLAACVFQTALAFAPIPLYSCKHSTSSFTARSASKSLGLRSKRKGADLCQMKIGGSGGSDDAVPPLERFVACLPYALPLSDSFEWGHYLFDKFPLLSIPFIPLFPVISLLNAPFVSFGVFIVLFSFVTRNPSFSRFIRFNTLQVRPPACCVETRRCRY
jgi:hypothetical protein